MSEQVRGRIEQLARAWEARTAARWPYENTKPPTVEVEFGKRYARIIQASPGSRSAAGFVDVESGAIYKAGGWKGPEKNHIRGSVLADDFGLSSFTDYGVYTMR